MEAPSCIWRLILPGPDQLMPHKTKENLKRLSVYKRKSLGLELKKKEHAKQHCFLQMFRAARSFDHSSSLRNWLATAFSLARQFLSRIHLQQVATHTHWTSLEATVSEFRQRKEQPSEIRKCPCCCTRPCVFYLPETTPQERLLSWLNVNTKAVTPYLPAFYRMQSGHISPCSAQQSATAEQHCYARISA